jgi:hypothetical protein
MLQKTPSEKLFDSVCPLIGKLVICGKKSQPGKTILPFGHVASLSIFPCLENSLGCWIPHHQSDSWQPLGVCLVVGDEGDGTVSGFVLRPLGRPGLPYFQSSYP